MDETGIAIGDTQFTLVLSVNYKDEVEGTPQQKRKEGKAWKAIPARGEWVTSIE